MAKFARMGRSATIFHVLERLLAKFKREGRELRVCYEAGPCGFGIARRLAQLRIECLVAAPSLLPKKSGDRIKNDKRDAIKLARLHRAGDLTAVHVPDATDEAVRDLKIIDAIYEAVRKGKKVALK